MNAPTAPPVLSNHLEGQPETVEQLIRRAHAALEAAGHRMSPSRVSTIMRAHVRQAGSVATAARMLEAYVLSYADPTGETAIRNVMRGAKA